MELGLGDDVKGHGTHMVYTCMTEMKKYDVGQWRYDVRVHVGSMVALWKTYVDE